MKNTKRATVCWVLSAALTNLFISHTSGTTTLGGCPFRCHCAQTSPTVSVVNCSNKDLWTFPFLGDYVQTLEDEQMEYPTADSNMPVSHGRDQYDPEGIEASDVVKGSVTDEGDKNDDDDDDEEEADYASAKTSMSLTGHVETENEGDKNQPGREENSNLPPRRRNVHAKMDEYSISGEHANRFHHVIDLYASHNSFHRILRSDFGLARNRVRVLEILNSSNPIQIAFGAFGEIANSLQVLKLDPVTADINSLIQQMSKLHQLKKLDLKFAVPVSNFFGTSHSAIVKSLFLGLGKLRTLRLVNGQISDMQPDIFVNVAVSLEELDLSQNRLQSFPEAVTKVMLCRSPMSRLSLAKNAIRELKLSDIPEDVCNLENLNLGFNKIMAIDTSALNRCPHLKVLDLSGNPCFHDKDCTDSSQRLLRHSLRSLDIQQVITDVLDIGSKAGFQKEGEGNDQTRQKRFRSADQDPQGIEVPFLKGKTLSTLSQSLFNIMSPESLYSYFFKRDIRDKDASKLIQSLKSKSSIRKRRTDTWRLAFIERLSINRKKYYDVSLSHQVHVVGKDSEDQSRAKEEPGTNSIREIHEVAASDDMASPFEKKKYGLINERGGHSELNSLGQPGQADLKNYGGKSLTAENEFNGEVVSGDAKLLEACERLVFTFSQLKKPDLDVKSLHPSASDLNLEKAEKNRVSLPNPLKMQMKFLADVVKEREDKKMFERKKHSGISDQSGFLEAKNLQSGDQGQSATKSLRAELQAEEIHQVAAARTCPQNQAQPPRSFSDCVYAVLIPPVAAANATDEAVNLNVSILGSRLWLFACMAHAALTFVAFFTMNSGREKK